ncbi:MAG: hypothetical protein WCA22_06705 [Candidatus Binatus sp.]
MKYGGWFKIAFERELERQLTTVTVGDRRLLCVKRVQGDDADAGQSSASD